MSLNFNMEEQKPIFTTAGDTMGANTTESYTPDSRIPGGMVSVLSPLARNFQSVGNNEHLSSFGPQEPRAGDIAPSTVEFDEDMLLNLRISGSEALFNDVDAGHNAQNYFMGSSLADSVASSNIWSDGPGTSSRARSGELVDTFEFLIKSLSSANNYVSMLTREQLYVLRSIRPSLLYEFLQEVAKIRSDKRSRRAAPNECAFCKNNGENEECYSKHALKDWRGRVLCPVLRAFRCPRCGATGDYAHTIKYCQENADAGLERSGSFASRRRASSSTSLLYGSSSQTAPPTPSASTAASQSRSSLWNNFSVN